jgi:hypothetical protein
VGRDVVRRYSLVVDHHAAKIMSAGEWPDGVGPYATPPPLGGAFAASPGSQTTSVTGAAFSQAVTSTPLTDSSTATRRAIFAAS